MSSPAEKKLTYIFSCVDPCSCQNVVKGEELDDIVYRRLYSSKIEFSFNN